MKPRWIGKQELPYDPGEPKGSTVYWNDVAPVGGKFAASGTLTDLSRTHILFNAGFLHAMTGHDPVALYWAEANRKGRLVLVELGAKLFAGEMSEPFDRVCFGCPNEEWVGLRNHLDRLSFLAQHGKQDAVWESTRDLWPALDPILARRLAIGRPAPPEPPLVNVNLYGLKSSVGEYVWKASKDPWRVPLYLTWVKVEPELKKRR